MTQVRNKKLIGQKQNQRAFTIIELLLVLGILSIVMIGASPYFGKFFSVNDTVSVKTRVLSDLHKAQSYSMSARNTSTWQVTYASQVFTLKRVSDSVIFDTFTIDSSLTVSGFSSVIFSKMAGTPDTPTTIVISGTGTTQNIVIGAQGVIGEP